MAVLAPRTLALESVLNYPGRRSCPVLSCPASPARLLILCAKNSSGYLCSSTSTSQAPNIKPAADTFLGVKERLLTSRDSIGTAARWKASITCLGRIAENEREPSAQLDRLVSLPYKLGVKVYKRLCSARG